MNKVAKVNLPFRGASKNQIPISAAEIYPKARLFSDYRRMLDQVPEIDACTISTPDHHHAPAAIRAMRLKKHVYVQKPLTHSVYEARALLKAARETKVATLMGNQGHSGDDVRKFCEFVWARAIGPVREVHCWTDCPIGKQGGPRPTGEKSGVQQREKLWGHT